MRILVLGLSLLLPVCASTATLAQPQASAGVGHPPVRYKVRVGLFPGFRMTALQAKALTDEITSIIEEADGSDDIECKVTKFESDGEPAEFAMGLPPVVDSPDAFNALSASNKSIHVVESISWCGEFAGAGQILGCAAEGGPVVVTRHPLAAIVWAHEMGHAQGLGHYPAWPENLMYPHALARMRKLLPGQCAAFRGPRLFSIVVADASGATPAKPASERIVAARAVSSAQPLEARSFEDFMQSVWPHNIPITQIDALTSEQLDRVRAFIRDKQYQYWPNSVIVIGLRGGVGDFDLFQTVLRENVDDEFVNLAKRNVGLALGHFANLTGHSPASTLLSALLFPQNAAEYFRGNVAAEIDARDLARNAARGATALPNKELTGALLQNQESSGRSGEINLNVGSNFYQGLYVTKDDIAARGLKNHLRSFER